MLNSMKARVAGFLRWHVTEPVRDLQMELLYQRLFDNECRNHGWRNDYRPVGAAASHGLLYLLARLFDEHEIRSVLEFGSGESTVFIDRVRHRDARHVCYEHDPAWHARIAARLAGCDYRLRPLAPTMVAGRSVQWYRDVEPQPFDLMLVDGPVGTERFSRFGCIELIRTCRARDFLIIFDDYQRPGERDTVAHAVGLLREAGVEFRANELRARTTQAVVAGGKFIGATYYY